MAKSAVTASAPAPAANNAQNQKKAAPVHQNHAPISFGLVFTAIVAIACVGLLFALPPHFHSEYIIGGERHASKPFLSFTEFYPFYLQEHSDELNRNFHFAGTFLALFSVLIQPVLISCLLIAFTFAYIACTLFAGESHGFAEFGILLASFLFFAWINRKFTGALLILVIGYFFAWVGHFVIEKNVPATFIYPAYSLMGDVRLFFELLIQKTVFATAYVKQHYL